MKYCPKCRTEYEDWAKLCGDCQVELVRQFPKEDVVRDKQGQKFVTIYSHTNESYIELVKTILESEGLECFIKGVDSMKATISGGIGLELQVPEKDSVRAMEILKEREIK